MDLGFWVCFGQVNHLSMEEKEMFVMQACKNVLSLLEMWWNMTAAIFCIRIIRFDKHCMIICFELLYYF